MIMDRREDGAGWVARNRRTHFSRGLWLMFMHEVQSSASSGQIVTMMQTAKSWHGNDQTASARALFCLTIGRRTLRKQEIRSILVIVRNVLVPQSPQMTLIEDDHIVKQIPAAVANPALSNPVLPRTPEADSFRLDTQNLYSTDDLFIKVGRPIENQIPRGEIVGECLLQLLRDPRTVRMFGDVEMQNLSSIMRDDEETIENAECERRHGEKVHPDDDFPMIAENRHLSLCRLGLLGAFLIQRRKVRLETSKPSMVNSPWMHGAPM